MTILRVRPSTENIIDHTQDRDLTNSYGLIINRLEGPVYKKLTDDVEETKLNRETIMKSLCKWDESTRRYKIPKTSIVLYLPKIDELDAQENRYTNSPNSLLLLPMSRTHWKFRSLLYSLPPQKWKSALDNFMMGDLLIFQVRYCLCFPLCYV